MTKKLRKTFKETYTVDIEVDAETGIAVEEVWTRNSVVDRTCGPAEILRDRFTGITWREVWYKDGVAGRSNPNLPTITIRDRKSGEVCDIIFYQDGVEAIGLAHLGPKVE